MARKSIILAGFFPVLMLLAAGTVKAQATPTPSSTPTPSCTIAPPGADSAFCDTGAETPPSFLGVSGGNYNSITVDSGTGATTSCCSETLGGLVQDQNGLQYVLSTNHTLARNSGSKKAKINEIILQPGLEELGCWQVPGDQVAQLSKWTTLNFKGGENELDAALAQVTTTAISQPNTPPSIGIDPLGRILNMGPAGQGGPYDALNLGQISTTPFPYDSIFDGMPVMKQGRTSCLTYGQIDGFDAIGNVVYSSTCGAVMSGVAQFDHQIIVIGQPPNSTDGSTCTFASTGDSGALVTTYNFLCPQAVGMVFAGASGQGADSGGVIVAVNPIDTILTGFKGLTLSLVGQQCSPPAAIEMGSNSGGTPTGISSALRASIEAVRSVKTRHGKHLIKIKGVEAVGIGAGSTSDTAALNVYLTQDTPEIRQRVLNEVKGANVKFKDMGSQFRGL